MKVKTVTQWWRTSISCRPQYGLTKSTPKISGYQKQVLELDGFSIPFNVKPTSALPELKLELIKLESDDTLKAMYLNKPSLEFYRLYESKK